MPRKFNGERKMFSTNGTEINESPHEEKKKEKCLKKYRRPDDNGLVLDLSTDYRAGYLLWKYFKPYTTLPCVHSVQFSSVTQLCPTLCYPMNCSMPGLPVHHQLPEFTQTHVHRVSDTIQPCHPLSSPSPPAPNPSQHQSLFQWVNSLPEVAKVLEF